MADKTEKILDIKVRYNNAVKEIAKYQKSIEEARNAEKEFKEQREKGEITEEEYRKRMVASKAAITDYKDAIRIITKHMQNQIKVERQAQGSLNSLRAQLSKLTAEYDALSEANRKGVVGQRIKKQMDEITSALKEGEEETQRYYRNVGNYEEAIKNALGLNNDFANSLLDMASNGKGASSMFTEISIKAKAFGKTLLGLMSNPIFIAFAGIAGAGIAFKWFYDYNKGLTEATRLTKQFTGLAGNELKSYRNEVQTLADMYGKDFQEVLRATNSVAKQFGMEQSEALRIIRDGFIAGADASGEYLDILREYPAYFNEAGISADQFVAIVANAAQQGIFSDKGIDAIKEANTRIREMTTATATAFEGIGMSSAKVQEELQNGSKTTFDVIQEVSNRLKDLPESSAEVGAALADIFGGAGEDAGLGYIKTLGDISTNLDEVKSKSGELGELQEQLLESQTNLENALSGLFDMTGGTFEEMTTNARIFINDGLIGIINGIKEIIGWFKGIYNESMAFRAIIQSVGTTFKSTYDIIASFIKTSIEQFRALGDVVKGVFTLDMNAIENGLKRFNEAIVKHTKGMVSNIKQNLSDFSQEVMNGSWGASDESGGITSSKARTGDNTTKATIKNSSNILSSASQAIKIKQKELAEVRKAEDAMLNLVKDSREKARKEIELNYSRQIEDLKNRLDTETDLTVKAREAINTQIKALEQQKDVELQKLSDEELKKEVENRQKLISLQLESVREGSEQEYQLRMEQLAVQRDAELADKELTEQMKLAIVEKYNRQMDGLTKQHEAEIRQKQTDAMRTRMENEIMELQQSGASELEMLKAQAEQKKQLYDSIRREDYDSEIEYQNARLQANQEFLDAKKELADKEVEIENSKANAMAAVTSAMGSLLEQAGENNKMAAVAAKTLAIAEVAISQGVAIANAVKAATQGSVTVWDLVANIATAVATVISTIATATKSIKSAKFASGGLVTGPGSGTSDSIPARLSNGESVMTARATEMFAPILSSFNMMGGGVPINVTQSDSQALGEDMLARAVAKGVQSIRPVVSVEEINTVNNRVQVLENLGNV